MTDDTSTALQERAARWHAARFPRCTVEDIALKAMSELGEVADAILAGGRDAAHPERAGTVLAECADVAVTLLAICGRGGHGDLLAAVDVKLRVLETPGGTHPGCLPGIDMSGWTDDEKTMAAELGYAEIARGIDALPDTIRSGSYADQARIVVQCALGMDGG